MRTLTSAPPDSAATTPWPHHLASIDLGSNSFRLEIGHVTPSSYKRIDYLKETVRLGAGLDEHGLLSDEAMLRGLACLARFAQRLQGYARFQVRAVATQTLREAQNREVFLTRAEAVLGHAIEVISGREEARLIYAGVARLQPSEVPRLVIDIGGRSTEMILGQGRTPLRAESFRVGSVSLSMRYFPEGRFTEAAFRDAQIAAGAELEEALVPFAPQHWQEALGSSGTAGAVSHVLQACGITNGAITPEALRWCIAQCLKAGRIERLDFPGLREDRRAVIAGGVAILYTLVTHFHIGALQPARGALRQGVIFDLDERHHSGAVGNAVYADMRDATIHALQRRFEIDVAQAQRVSVVANSLLACAVPQADAQLQRELSWACALHEIGMMVSHHDHHRHSAYLLSHVDAAGFSQSQQRRLAELVLAQRGGLRKVESQLALTNFAWQVLCLRLAIIECHSREDITATALQLRCEDEVAVLTLPPAWQATHPRTLFLLGEEVAVWERSGVLSLVIQG
jgi:exopolyphosphatase / guanosine-5'-triphosphate,3'-diphosphate pyrophosphatase